MRAENETNYFSKTIRFHKTITQFVRNSNTNWLVVCRAVESSGAAELGFSGLANWISLNNSNENQTNEPKVEISGANDRLIWIMASLMLFAIDEQNYRKIIANFVNDMSLGNW